MMLSYPHKDLSSPNLSNVEMTSKVADTHQEQANIIRTYLFPNISITNQEDENVISRIPTRTLPSFHIQRSFLFVAKLFNITTYKTFNHQVASLCRVVPHPNCYYVFFLGRITC